MEGNLVKEKLNNNEYVIGTFITMGSTGVAEILSGVGFDYLLIDKEHGLMGLETAGAMMGMMKSKETVPFVRVEKNDHVAIGQALDAGAHGIMIPMVNSAEEAKKAVMCCKYPLEGVRGVGAGHVSMYGVNLKSYLQKANNNVAVIVQIEHIDAVEHIEEIVNVEGIDAVFVGPSDLASSMGYLGQAQHPQVQKEIDKVRDCCLKNNVNLGIYCFSHQNIIDRIEEGYKFITYGSDSSFLSNSAKQLVEEIKTKA